MFEIWGNAMTKSNLIQGRSAAIRIANLDTDQIMPKQFLHGIDKMGLDKGVLYDLRFDRNGMCPLANAICDLFFDNAGPKRPNGDQDSYR